MPAAVASPAAKAPEILAPRLYRLRCLEGAPFDHLTVGGQSFSKQTERVSQDADGRTARAPIAGAVTPLTDEQLAFVRGKIADKRVRWTSRATMRAMVFDAKTGPNREQRGDEPLSKWVAIEETDEIADAL